MAGALLWSGDGAPWILWVPLDDSCSDTQAAPGAIAAWRVASGNANERIDQRKWLNFRDGLLFTVCHAARTPEMIRDGQKLEVYS